MSDVRHIQHYLMLSRRLGYPGGRKARSADRRMRELERPLRAFVHDVSRQMHTVGLRLLAGVCARPSGSGGAP